MVAPFHIHFGRLYGGVPVEGLPRAEQGHQIEEARLCE